jgi:hypothetical protein
MLTIGQPTTQVCRLDPRTYSLLHNHIMHSAFFFFLDRIDR